MILNHRISLPPDHKFIRSKRIHHILIFRQLFFYLFPLFRVSLSSSHLFLDFDYLLLYLGRRQFTFLFFLLLHLPDLFLTEVVQTHRTDIRVVSFNHPHSQDIGLYYLSVAVKETLVYDAFDYVIHSCIGRRTYHYFPGIFD